MLLFVVQCDPVNFTIQYKQKQIILFPRPDMLLSLADLSHVCTA